jgi:DNA replication protein DnaC
MEDRHLYRGKRTLTDNMWVQWDGFSGVQPNTVIEEETICQCTGLKDKNGKLIWENDILMCHGNAEDLVKAVFGEFNIINAETLEVVDRVIGWHYEVVPTDAPLYLPVRQYSSVSKKQMHPSSFFSSAMLTPLLTSVFFNNISTACKIIKTYLDDFESQKERGMGLYIWSRTKGSGKTRIAAGIANELMKRYTVKFAVSLTILQEIKNTWRRDTECSENQLLDALYTTEILVIDDFGVERPADWINDKMYQIINERYINRKVTIFTSNDPLETLQYDDRITNRIKERTYQIAFPEESVRDHIAEQLREEIIEKVINSGGSS